MKKAKGGGEEKRGCGEPRIAAILINEKEAEEAYEHSQGDKVFPLPNGERNGGDVTAAVLLEKRESTK